jgi:hypothetical protein
MPFWNTIHSGVPTLTSILVLPPPVLTLVLGNQREPNRPAPLMSALVLISISSAASCAAARTAGATLLLMRLNTGPTRLSSK